MSFEFPLRSFFKSVSYRVTRKAFFGHIPFPVIHIDTSFKIPDMNKEVVAVGTVGAFKNAS